MNLFFEELSEEDELIEVSTAIKEQQEISLEQRVNEIQEQTTTIGNEFFSVNIEYHPGIWEQDDNLTAYSNNLETQSTTNPYYNNLRTDDVVIEQPVQEEIQQDIEDAKFKSSTGLIFLKTCKTAVHEEVLKVQRIINFTLNTVLYDIL